MRKIRVFSLCFGLILSSFGLASAQKASTSSPYSKFGIGELRGSQLPQSRAMGGIATGVRYMGGYSNINTTNPASYSAIQYTTMDVGVFGNISELSNQKVSENAYNFGLSHINFAFPLGNAGGISVGIQPFSDMGYNYTIHEKLDTTAVNKVYAGEGGTNIAYLGYGVRLNKNFSVGFNANYVFGTLTSVRSLEYPDQVGSLNGREDLDNRIQGLTVDYGVQYFKNIAEDMSLVIGYNGTAGNQLSSRVDYLAIRTPSSVSGGTDNLPVDTISFIAGEKQKIGLPLKHSLGFTVSKSNKWMMGADVNYEKWSDFKQGGVNVGLADSYGFAVGGQFTPDPTSVKYLSVVDYRLGFRYNKSYIQIAEENVNQMALTLGLGLPLPSLFGASFYKVNFAAELGQMGKISDQLVRDRYVKFSLGFTLNDRWFRRASYD